LKLTTDRHEASRGLFATTELLLSMRDMLFLAHLKAKYVMVVDVVCPVVISQKPNKIDP